MTVSKAKSSEQSKSRTEVKNAELTEVKKAGLQVKPIKDLELDRSQSENIRGGGGAPGTGRGFLWSDIALKSEVEPIKGALAKLRQVRL